MKSLTEFIVQDFLCGMNIAVFQKDKRIDLSLTNDGEVWRGEKDGVSLAITAHTEGDSTFFSIDLVSDKPLNGHVATMRIDPSSADNALANSHDNLWWMMGSWPKKADEVFPRTQGFLLEKDGRHISLVYLVGDLFRAEVWGDGIHFDIGCDGFTKISGPFLTVTAADRPMDAVEKNFEFARAKKLMITPLRREKEYPAVFEKLGWCTWNAFYQEITSEKLYEKLEEFKEKNVPVKWIIIDDGWSITRDGKLSDFSADPAKFPEGLKECIRRIKEDYGIEAVGVWHNASGYWQGIDPQSFLAKEFADCLMPIHDSPNGIELLASDDPDRAFRFWDAWHSYLADCGVDFLKVDAQSSFRVHFEKNISGPVGSRSFHEALERSVNKNFGGALINCMGMDMDNVLARPSSSVSRNSEDFFPDHDTGFVRHLSQNLYNSIWHSQLYYCDYDMWWSSKSDAVQSGVLRAISGGPVYISDELGGTNPEMLLPICDISGDICRLDNIACPTTDCLYLDCPEEGRAIKAYNSKGDAIALAVFNVTQEKITETFTFDVIPSICNDKEYIAYEYFTKQYKRITAASCETVTLDVDKVLSYSIYPIENDGEGEYIMMGGTDRYVGIGAHGKKKVAVKDIL